MEQWKDIANHMSNEPSEHTRPTTNLGAWPPTPPAPVPEGITPPPAPPIIQARGTELPRSATRVEKFAAFNRLNPEVYDWLVSLARELMAAGIRKTGIKGLIEQLRWQYHLQTRGDCYKINNDFAPHYARLIMANEADLDGFFDTRRSSADKVA